jgi:glycine cleavage system H protein
MPDPPDRRSPTGARAKDDARGGAAAVVPADLRYTKEHEWVRFSGDEATIGITRYAADQLGDVVFVELPETGRTLQQFATFGVVESVKAVSDLFAPLTGDVSGTNDALRDQPELVI